MESSQYSHLSPLSFLYLALRFRRLLWENQRRLLRPTCVWHPTKKSTELLPIGTALLQKQSSPKNDILVPMIPEELPRRPAKYPKDFCKKKKGSHEFAFLAEEQWDQNSVNSNRVVTPHVLLVRKYQCTACQKIVRTMLRDGIYYAGKKEKNL